MEDILQQSKALFHAFREQINLFFARVRILFGKWKVAERTISAWFHAPWFPLTAMLPLAILVVLLIRSLPAIMEAGPLLVPAPKQTMASLSDSAGMADQMANEKKEIGRLEKDLARLTPRSPYLVINTTSNSFKLYAGMKLVREGVCSTGSYTLLTDGKEKKWYFQTPKGVFRIRNKTKNPVWKKPDWAFVEEGLPVPPANHPSRIEYGTLGDYALGLGDGYMIHGTLYQRFLGMPVTHGCVRMGDDDLETVFKTLPIGAQVYIY